MTRLLDSVRLYLHPNLSLSEPRVWLNSGVHQPNSSELDELKGTSFTKDAYIPNDDWQILTEKQSKQLLAQNRFNDYSRTVSVFSVPKNILQPLQQLKISQLPPTQTSVLNQAHYKEAIAPILHHFTSYCRDRNPNLAGIGISPPGLPTITINQQQSIGLHLDSWDRLPLARRHQSTNRICINLGTDDRYFLFINLTLLDMLTVLRYDHFSAKEVERDFNNKMRWKFRKLFYKYRSNKCKASPLALKNAFVRRYPNYPVIKVKIIPGEAYVAPTENIIHDGSSLGQQHFDVQLTLRGHFRL
ncbi:hypothetical protein IQ260_21965 [Leptolyngbya cf. ectocarpi LEGE 11479]|uniref:Uncharacterized protein n=1 Tax=Leptolyngbya cf. ectocarpi LEGE 11479 TaxID=1828722 RepID=A0A928ZXM0_LEPEC|nr:hypothetical protein [Leptolyngbya ectocarpi]MBE9069313.1 hypothetical protein [Leptolyngbya cf. ectocarpi LEGE 11479]